MTCYFAGMDVVDLRNFYAQHLGVVARRFVGRGIRARWTDTRAMRVLGIGYATPYLGLFREEAERCLALMPAPQGVVRWPSARPALTALVEEDELPLTDSAVDRVLLVHALEMSPDPAELLREAWRVLAAGGRLLAVVPNRRGVWARMDTTPFGHGRPYSRTQITQLLRDTWFTPTGWGEALYVPPISRSLVSALGRRLGAHRRDAVGAVRRRPHRRGNQAGLSRHSGTAGKTAPRSGAQAGAGALAGRDGDALTELGSSRMQGMTINCDMGEGFGLYRMGNDAALMPHIDLANVACGFHASDRCDHACNRAAAPSSMASRSARILRCLTCKVLAAAPWLSHLPRWRTW